jgi:hypothetical protein
MTCHAVNVCKCWKQQGEEGIAGQVAYEQEPSTLSLGKLASLETESEHV